MVQLRIQKFARLLDVCLDLGDLTLLVGPHGSGKGLALQWLKIAVNGYEEVSGPRSGHNVFFMPMDAAASVKFRGRDIRYVPDAPKSRAKANTPVKKLMFIPSNRELESVDKFNSEYTKLSWGDVSIIRDEILLNKYLPVDLWSSGHKAFASLFLSLRTARAKGVEWVVIEEPESGLRPEALNIILVLILDLMRLGKKVVISTHSLDLVTAVWMLINLKKRKSNWKLARIAFSLGQNTNRFDPTIKSALSKNYRTYYFDSTSPMGTVSDDISTLNVDSEDAIVSNWGDLLTRNSLYGDVVSEAINAKSL